MKPSIETKLKANLARYEEIRELLSDPEVTSDINRYRELSKEYAHTETLAQLFMRYQDYQKQLADSETLLQEDDAEIKEMAAEEIRKYKDAVEKLDAEFTVALLPKDPHDNNNIFLEIRAGTGGDEAAIFAGDLSRMYTRYAENVGWTVEVMSESHGEHGGYKEVILRIIGQGAYSRFKFESGVHRVQRVPATEAQGRIHTSTCTVAVLPELEEIEDIDINPADIRTDTFRASGAGGQHVQKTDSAIRITHIPTGTVVECQDERSQHKNRARAMSLLKARILSAEQEKQHKQQADQRRSLVGTGDRSERIRTYNYPQGRVTDHRINLTLYQLTYIMEGDLSALVQALSQEYTADLLASLGES